MSIGEARDRSRRLNLHIFLSDVKAETRLFKEAQYTKQYGIFDRVVVLGLWSLGLEEREVTSFGLEIRRRPVFNRLHRSAWPLRFWLLRKAASTVSLLEFAVWCVAQAKGLRASHISCHNVMLLPIAWTAARISGAKLVYVPHELETRRSGLGGLQRLALTLVERLFIGAAKQVVVVCDPIADWYRKAYGLANVQVVRNVPEADAIRTRKVPEGTFRDRFAIPDTATVFIYQGLFGKARGTDRLIEIFSALPPEKAQLVLMGYGEGSEQGEIEAEVARHPNMHLQPAVARDWIVSYTAGADVGIFIVQTAPLSYRYSLPNKFFEFTHAGLPVLLSDNLELQSQIVAAEGLGWSVPYEQIKEKILDIASQDLSPYRARAKAFARSAVWEADAKAFETVYR